jgi:hypothetical protein
MKKIFTTTALIMAAATMSMAQTNAKNWTAKDCGGTSHTLHDELDNGKIIVMVWVMPCGSCVNPSKAAYNAVQNFAATHADKVVFYMVDDYGDSDCSTLSSWVSGSSIGDANKIKLFDNKNNAINMDDYGTAGMPKVAVVAGKDHKIYYNKNNSAANDVTGITSAISSAIATNVENMIKEVRVSVTPNPVTAQMSVTSAKPIQKVVVTAMNGQVVKEENYKLGKKEVNVNMSQIPSGNYIVNVTDGQGGVEVQQIVKQ